jgi:hypothetical protein
MGKAKILLLSAVAALLILGLVVYVARALPSNPGPVSWIEWLVIFICLVTAQPTPPHVSG